MKRKILLYFKRTEINNTLVVNINSIGYFINYINYNILIHSKIISIYQIMFIIFQNIRGKQLFNLSKQ